jgi:pyrimidine oxygenase
LQNPFHEAEQDMQDAAPRLTFTPHRDEERFVMKIGVFVPIGNNGWLISTTAPQYKADLRAE